MNNRVTQGSVLIFNIYTYGMSVTTFSWYAYDLAILHTCKDWLRTFEKDTQGHLNQDHGCTLYGYLFKCILLFATYAHQLIKYKMRELHPQLSEKTLWVSIITGITSQNEKTLQQLSLN